MNEGPISEPDQRKIDALSGRTESMVEAITKLALGDNPETCTEEQLVVLGGACALLHDQCLMLLQGIRNGHLTPEVEQ
jgi:hypothetical protein